MIEHEKTIKRFITGISVLTHYITLCGSCNLHDINVMSENLVGSLLHIFYGWKLHNDNEDNCYNAVYDLIDKKNRIIVQVTSSTRPEKIQKTLDALKKKNKSEIDFKGYTLYFVILKEDAQKMRNYKGRSRKGYICPEGIYFDAKKNIYDFGTFVKKVNNLSEIEDDRMNELKKILNSNRTIFGSTIPEIRTKNQIDDTIKEYADNYTAKLFQHAYERDSKVTLDRLFVEPKLYCKGEKQQELIAVLSKFLWDEKENRTLIIEGDAAIGKTSIISYLCYHYVHQDKIGNAVFLQSNLVCVRLRELNFSDTNEGMENILLKYFKLSSWDEYRAEYDYHVIILDGADELAILERWKNNELEELIRIFRKIFRKSKIIITSRPQFVDADKLKFSNFGVRTMQLQHFDQRMRETWMEKYEKCGERITQKTKEYILGLDETSAVGVADTPLALYLLVKCNMSNEMQGNIWMLYHEIFSRAIIDTEYDDNFRSSLKHPIRGEKDTLYKIVCAVAFEMYKNPDEASYGITCDILDKIVHKFDVATDNIEWTKKSCVLCTYWKNDGKTGRLEFYHNNIRDYFLCEYIYDKINPLLMDGSDESIEEFFELMCSTMSYINIAGTTWEETFVFLYERLRYESKELCSEKEKQKINETVEKIYSRLLSVNERIWNYPYKVNHYQRIKYTVANTLLLARIFQEGLGVKIENQKNKFWSSEKEQMNICKSGILAEWSSTFSYKISIPNRIKISIGQNCVFDGISFEMRGLETARFENSLFKNILFDYATLKMVSFESCKLLDINFANAILIDVDFSDAVLKACNFSGATLKKCKFFNTRIEMGNFDHCKIEGCIFEEVNMIDCSGVEI